MQAELFSKDDSIKKRTESWVLTDHLCRSCCGRLLRRRVSPTVNEVMCSECESRSYGNELSLCWCGKNLTTHGSIFECMPNPQKRPELPNAVMVREKKIAQKFPSKQ